ncbi:MAG: glyoxalase [Rhodobacteraceae bacterium CG17_big_fil_post_rev_8_21_14_2_50_65_11]|nr:MAG: glyoxalase [Rhodobacteraceae bacterium CG17_big_fil_post_rev_8_21_14_2_50_65_11]
MSYTADPGLRVGHVHLKVSDLDRSIAFYRDVLGLEVQQRLGSGAAFLSAGGYHHHLGLNTWQSCGGSHPPRGATGLYHVAFLYPTRDALGRAVARVVDLGVPLAGAADHGVSEAVYFDDPDGNGVELYRDRAPEDWPRDATGALAMSNAPLDVDGLISQGARANSLPALTRS